MKALGVGLGAFGFHEVWVERADSGSAVAGRSPEPRRRARRSGGVTRWHLSITHSDLIAIAYVVAE